jgi:hypothetical protein
MRNSVLVQIRHTVYNLVGDRLSTSIFLAHFAPDLSHDVGRVGLGVVADLQANT